MSDGLRIDALRIVEGALGSNHRMHLVKMYILYQFSSLLRYHVSTTKRPQRFETHLLPRNSLISSNKANLGKLTHPTDNLLGS